MLDFMRKHANSWFATLIIGAIVVVFVLWGIGTMRSAQFQKVAEVDDTKIYLPEYLRAYQNLMRTYQERLGSDFNEETMKALNLKAQTVNQLIDEVLVRQAAQRLGLVVTDAELRQHISRYPAFRDDRGFNEVRYQQLLARQRIAPSDFEAQERQRLLFQKVVGFITSFAKVSEADLQETYRLENEAVRVNYLVVSPAAFLKEQQVAPGDVEAYFDKHKEQFREPEKFQFRYAFLKFSDFESKIKPDPAKIEAFYYDHLDQFAEPQAIRLQEIFLPVPAGAAAPERQRLRQVADAILKNAQSGVPFDQLVKQYSQVQLKVNDLGVVQRSPKIPEWQTAAFTLNKGESILSVSPTGLHIMHVIDIVENKAPALASIQPRVEKAWRQAEARDLARQQAAALREESRKSSFAEVLKQHRLTIQETPLITAKEAIPGLGPQPAVSQALQGLKPQEIGSPISLAEGVVLLQLVNRQDSFLPTLAGIRNKVTDTVRLQQAKEAAAREAQKMLARLQKGESLAKVAAEKKLTVQDTGFFTRPQGFPGHPQARNLTSAAFSLTDASPYPPESLSQGGDHIILAFKERRQPNPEQFAQVKQEMEKSLLDIKRQIVFSQWLAEERRHAKIEVYELPS